jgi:ATP-dependent DNA helicase RecG
MAAPANSQPIQPLLRPLASLWGIGVERAAQLARLGMHTVGDLLLHRPRRYEDRRHSKAIADLQPGEADTVRGKVVAMGTNYYRKRAKSVFEIIVDDGTARLHCRWWNLPFMEKYFGVGDDVFVFGKPVSLKPRTMDHPETEVVEPGEEASIHINRIAPVYPLTEGLPQRWLRSLVWRTLGQYEKYIAEPRPELKPGIVGDEPAGRGVPSAPRSLAAGWRAAESAPCRFPIRANAVRLLHFPGELADAEIGRRRLALDEFIDLQWAVQTRRRRLQANARALPCGGDNHLIKPFLKRLGFELTEAQTKVLREIRKDMGGTQPMRRLLQGDVGSGKTVVAACTALMALESGFNVALMAPTEILAEQHSGKFREWFAPLDVLVQLRTGSRKPSNLEVSTASGILIIGTHALLEGAFALDRLGLVIIDEQHKFGVAQRETLVRKGRYPHLLVMTATPIPRTLGLTLYGDLDSSVIDQLPAGRGVVKTFVREADRLPKVWEFIRARLAEGRQVYVVYPRVEEADLKTGVKAVTVEFERLQKELAPFQVGLLHGRQASAEKERVMADFRGNRVQVLLATTVIEVGVDVPNATVMLIENAEQFGLAQLHQLRGRIGRGAHDSFCILVASVKTDEARQRLRVVEETSDGFRIAEADLELRGPGELLGQQQSGLPPFRFGDLAKDRGLVERARELVAEKLGSERA